MKTPCMVIAIATLAVPAIASASEVVIDGSAAAIREVISGKTCTGDDVLIFGEITRGTDGTYDRRGSTSATYSIGYGTILVNRDRKLHGHLASVSVSDHMLYMSTNKYQCGD